MQRTLFVRGARRSVVATLSLLIACSGDVTLAPPGPAPNGGEDAGTGTPIDGDGDDEPPVVTLDAIAIEPAELELTLRDGARPEAYFTVRGTHSDGSEVDVRNALFTLGDEALGTLGAASGAFVPFGTAGGETTVRATLEAEGRTLEASAVLRVRLVREVSTNLPPEASAAFDGQAIEDAARAASIVYPLEGAVMPQNVFPADVQWLTGQAGDLFEVRYEKPHASVRAIVQHDGTPSFGNHYLLDQTAWRALASSDPDAPLTITVTRYEAATSTLVASPAVHMTFARAALSGSIYYWDIEAGQIRRIDDGTNQAIAFMPTPPEAIGGGARCVGCHSVSPSGRYMAGRLGGGDNVGGVFDLTTDLSQVVVPTVFPVITQSQPSARWFFSSWSPDEKRMVVSVEEHGGARRLSFLDPFTGATIAMNGALPQGATHPAWSPDGTQIAYTAANGWGGDHSLGDIMVLPVTGNDVGTAALLHAGTSLADAVPAGGADSYPTWSPDSRLIAFGHGNNSRSETGQSALYAMARDGTNVVRLDRASGGASAVDSFQPRFSPFDQGGYYWVSFLSRRDYGNGEVGTRGTARQQVWVAAIKKDAAPGEDPSEVGYWIAGQNTQSRNISAYWAPRACRDDGQSCAVGSECCGGLCGQNAEGELVCSPPPPEECRKDGQTCASDGDCCEGEELGCFDHVCMQPVK